MKHNNQNKLERLDMKKVIITVMLCTMITATPISGVACAEEAVITLNSYSAYMCDYDTGAELYSKNADERHEIASMVKIMTALLVIEEAEKGNLSYEDKTVVSQNAAKTGGSQMFLDYNEQYSINDLLKGLIVVSANDAAVALAEHISGNVESFVVRMNERAKELGANNTLYANCTGLPSDNEQYSTAKDVSLINRELIAHDKYYEFAKIWLEDYTHPSGRVTQFANTNKLIRHYKGCLGGKTGYTDNAKYCLSAVAERNELKLITTVIGSPDSKTRFAETSKLFNYAFANYTNYRLVVKGDNIENEIKVEKGKSDTVKLEYADSVSILCKTNEEKPSIELDLPQTIMAGVNKGDKVGTAVISHEGKTYSVDIVASETIEKISFWDQFKDIINEWQIGRK